MAGSKQIEVRSIDDLSLDPENARKHSETDIAAIARSLQQFGQQTPIVVDDSGIVVKGNGTILAAMQLGWEEIEVIETSLTGQELRAYAIADNRTAELSQWNTERLIEQLQGFEDQALREATAFDEAAILALCSTVPDAEPPSFEPVSVEEQGKLDELLPKLVECPHCRQEFDLRQVPQR